MIKSEISEQKKHSENTVLWSPNEEIIAQANSTKFIAHINTKFDLHPRKQSPDVLGFDLLFFDFFH